MRKMRRVIVLLIAVTLLTPGCLWFFGAEEDTEEEGTIVLNLSRRPQAEIKSEVAFLSQALDSASEDEWPRSVEDVLAVLEGYRVRVQGEDVDVFKDAFFEEGEDEVTVEISIPAGDDYSVTVLALGEASFSSRRNLLGAGQTGGVTAGAEEPTIVTVQMEPYRCNFEAPEQVESGAQIKIEYEIKGPLLSFLFGSPHAGLYYSLTPPERDKFGDRTGERGEIITQKHWQFKFTVPGQSEEGLLYYQVMMGTGGWRYDNIIPRLYFPSISLDEEIPTIQIGAADGGIIIDPEW